MVKHTQTIRRQNEDLSFKIIWKWARECHRVFFTAKLCLFVLVHFPFFFFLFFLLAEMLWPLPLSAVAPFDCRPFSLGIISPSINIIAFPKIKKSTMVVILHALKIFFFIQWHCFKSLRWKIVKNNWLKLTPSSSLYKVNI